ncbi:MAG: hypothetical protein U0Q07_15050 [Acidimicrobiales bacterium]
MAAIFERTDTDRLAGIPLGTGTTGAAPRIAPRGPSGLWDALARADVARADATTTPPAADTAHLAYLARVATPVHEAEVVDLAAYRARRGR